MDYSPIEDDGDLQKFYDRLRSHSFDDSSCFLCAKSFNEVEPTSEHVFPRWLQKRFNLWDQRLTLLNRTSIPYRQLTVPCCVECNSYRLQPIETAVSSAVIKGYQFVNNLDKKTLFLWLGKIFYGILFKELFLLLNREENDGITIATPAMLKDFETHLILLQQVREKVEYFGNGPGSIFVFRTQTPRDIRLQWDMCDNVDTMFIAIRMGDVGIIGCLADGGAQLIYENAYKDVQNFPLHPLQFRELCAQFSYRATLATRTPKLISIEDTGTPHKMIQMPLGGYSLKPYFDEWDTRTYAQFLSFYTGRPLSDLFTPPDSVTTWLREPSGNPHFIDVEEHPYY